MESLNEIKVNPIAKEAPEIGIDTNNTLLSDIIDAAQIGSLDISSIDALNQSAQTREQTYQLLDSMAQDDVIAAVLETYAEDTVQTNDKGESIWIECADAKILDYVSWLLDSLNVNKHLYQWAHCLITYGDVYLRLFRNSDMQEDKLFKNMNEDRRLNESKEKLNEDVRIKIYAAKDKYIPYVQMVDNPGEMFDLQKFVKTHGYIKASTRVTQQVQDQMYQYLTNYKMKQSDVEIYDAQTFVHGCIEATNQRQPETVDIYLDNNSDPNERDADDSMTASYSIKRGQSILYNSFRIWRELNLLEMSALLNRLTKSSVVRILNVDTGDMGKEQVRNFLQRLREKLEQKAAIKVDGGMSEYTNPGPIENTIIVPTHGTQGQISPQNIGGDFDPKSLVDLEYFRDKLFGSLKVPKQFFGFTEDGAGFDGGKSLSILSARYGKSIKNIQNILCQLITDLLNLFLIDRGLDNYIYKFQVRMQEPITQEELDRRANNDTRIRYVSDLMQQFEIIKDEKIKLKMYKSLITPVINDPEVTQYIQDYIDQIEEKENKKGKKENNPEEAPEENNDFGSSDMGGDAFGGGMDTGFGGNDFGSAEEPSLGTPEETFGSELPTPEELPNEGIDEEQPEKQILNETGKDDEDDSYLPTGEELGIDLTQKIEKE